MDFDVFDVYGDFLWGMFSNNKETGEINIEGMTVSVTKEEFIKNKGKGYITVEVLLDLLAEHLFNTNKAITVIFSPDVIGYGFESFEMSSDILLHNKAMAGKDVLNSPFAEVRRISDYVFEIVFINTFDGIKKKEQFMIEHLSCLGLKYVTRDENGDLYAWQYMPQKQKRLNDEFAYWFFPDDVVGNFYRILDDRLFNYVLWEQDEPSVLHSSYKQ